MKLSKWERCLHVVAVVGFMGIMLATVSGQAVKNSDVAAWLSMLFNAVMAAAAVGAFLTARKWLPQLTTQEGYKEAITLVNEILLPLDKWESLHDCLCRIDHFSNELHQGRQARGNPQAEFTRLDTILSNLDKIPDSIRLQQGRLATYGLKGSEKYQAELSGLEQKFRELLAAAKRLEKRLREDFPLHEQYKKAQKLYGAFKTRDHEASLQKAKQTLATSGERIAEARRSFDETYGLLTEVHNRLFQEGPGIGELFVLRK